MTESIYSRKPGESLSGLTYIDGLWKNIMIISGIFLCNSARWWMLMFAICSQGKCSKMLSRHIRSLRVLWDTWSRMYELDNQSWDSSPDRRLERYLPIYNSVYKLSKLSSWMSSLKRSHRNLTWDVLSKTSITVNHLHNSIFSGIFADF